jgi:PRTRC genetic system protein A
MTCDLELERMLVDHSIGKVPWGSVKPVSYVMQGNGLWEIRRNAIGVFCRHLAKARVPGLVADLLEGFDLAVPKIPLPLLWQAVAFFRKVYEDRRSESAVRAIFDRKAGEYFLDCPRQEVSPAHCGFDRALTPDNGVVVLELHSHGGFDAAFSPTDDKDELADRFYGIVGRVPDFLPQLCFRVSIGGKRLPVDVSDLFDLGSDPMLGARFPAEWLGQVSDHRPKPQPGSPRRFLDDPDDPENSRWPRSMLSGMPTDDPDESTIWDDLDEKEKEPCPGRRRRRAK